MPFLTLTHFVSLFTNRIYITTLKYLRWWEVLGISLTQVESSCNLLRIKKKKTQFLYSRELVRKISLVFPVVIFLAQCFTFSLLFGLRIAF